jgi:hypothetical protein
MSAAFFIAKARHCRELAKLTQDPELRDQLLSFAREFEEKAQELAAAALGSVTRPQGSWAH